MTQEQILDGLLHFIPKYKEFEASKNFLIHSFWLETKGTGLEKYMIDNAINKLEKDGYLSTSIINVTPLIDGTDKATIYTITWEGQFFISRGGYQGETFRASSEKKRLADVEKQSAKTAKQMVILTRWIVAGTIIAGIYYLLEILKFANIIKN